MSAAPLPFPGSKLEQSVINIAIVEEQSLLF